MRGVVLEEYEESREELSAVEAEIGELREAVEATERERETLGDRIGESREELTAAQEKRDELLGSVELPAVDADTGDGIDADRLAAAVDDRIDTVREEIEVLRESTPLGATGRNPAVYVSDPFGYTLELKQAQ